MYWKLRRVFASDGVIDLIPINLELPDEELGFGECFDFVITPHGHRREAGRVSLRLGESEAMYYFGHIGYHVDPPYRGGHFALRACKLLKPLLQITEKTDIVITCDPDNTPSRKTIEALGCAFENEVSVPRKLQERW